LTIKLVVVLLFF